MRRKPQLYMNLGWLGRLWNGNHQMGKNTKVRSSFHEHGNRYQKTFSIREDLDASGSVRVLMRGNQGRHCTISCHEQCLDKRRGTTMTVKWWANFTRREAFIQCAPTLRSEHIRVRPVFGTFWTNRGESWCFDKSWKYKRFYYGFTW